MPDVAPDRGCDGETVSPSPQFTDFESDGGCKTDAANDGAVAGAQPGQVSGEVPVGGENGSDVNRTESGNEAGAHKTVGRGRVHQVTKHTQGAASRRHWSIR